MKKVLRPLLIATLLTSGAAFASDDCYDPVDTWQPEEHLQQNLESNGWQVDRIKIDDGCYEVKGVDTLGNRFEAIYSPASLEIRELEIKFNEQGSAEDYLDRSAVTR